MLKLFRMIQNRRFVMVGDGKALFQPAYIDDVVEGFRLALRNPKAVGEAFIVGGEEYVPLKSLVAMIAEELEVPPPRLRLPLGPVLWPADLCERIFVPLKREPPLHRRRVSFFQNNRAFTGPQGERDPGVPPFDEPAGRPAVDDRLVPEAGVDLIGRLDVTRSRTP